MNMKTRPLGMLGAGAVAVAALALGAGAANAAPAAAPAPVYVASIGNIPFTTLAKGTGASAVVNAGDTFSLTVGAPTATTYAQAELALPTNSALSTVAPTLATDNYAAGSPRWVLQLGNGKTLFGYPAQFGSTTDNWEVNGVSGYFTYDQAVQKAGGYGQVVANAFIVADGDQAAGTTDVVSHVSYGGTNMTVALLRAPRPHLYGGHVIFVNNNDAQVGWYYGPGVTCVLTRTFGPNMTSANGKPHPGFTCYNKNGLGIGFWSGLAAGHTYAIRYIPASPVTREALPNAQVGWITLVTTR